MQLTYYPGCSLEGSAREYDESIREICKALDIGIEEIGDWSCCGANAAAAVSEELGAKLVLRNLAIAEKHGGDLLVPCVGCYNRFRWAHSLAVDDAPAAQGMNYKGGVTLVSPLDLFRQPDARARLAARIAKPLSNLKIACYYGCVIVRPPEVTGVKDYENPQTLEELMGLLGAQSVDWPTKTDCCGSDLGIVRPDIMKSLVAEILKMADDAGADALAVACPLCHSNLDTRQDELVSEGMVKRQLPVFYFSELMALALGVTGVKNWWSMHLADPRPLLSRLGLA